MCSCVFEHVCVHNDLPPRWSWPQLTPTLQGQDAALRAGLRAWHRAVAQQPLQQRHQERGGCVLAGGGVGVGGMWRGQFAVSKKRCSGVPVPVRAACPDSEKQQLRAALGAT